ncbi:hypothetical protein KCU64_g49, partial [Aureobasidium melanogenum]
MSVHTHTHLLSHRAQKVLLSRPGLSRHYHPEDQGISLISPRPRTPSQPRRSDQHCNTRTHVATLDATPDHG